MVAKMMKDVVDADENSLMTVREVCQLLHIHANTLRRWGAKGLVKEYRIGSGYQRRFKSSDVAMLIGTTKR